MTPVYRGACRVSAPFESSYAVLSRFAAANVLSGAEVVRLFKSRARPYEGIRVGLESLYSIRIAEVEHILQLSKEKIYTLFLVPTYRRNCETISPYLRYCPVCMMGRQHFTFFQLDRLAQCPVHHVALRSRCAQCAAFSGYDLTAGLFAAPFCCPTCFQPLGHMADGAPYLVSHADSLTRAAISALGVKSNALAAGREQTSFHLWGSEPDGWAAIGELVMVVGMPLPPVPWQLVGGCVCAEGPGINASRESRWLMHCRDPVLLRLQLIACIRGLLRRLRRHARRARCSSRRRVVEGGASDAGKVAIERRNRGVEMGRIARAQLESALDDWMFGFKARLGTQLATSLGYEWFVIRSFCVQFHHALCDRCAVGRHISFENCPDLVRRAGLGARLEWYAQLVNGGMISYRLVQHRQFPIEQVL